MSCSALTSLANNDDRFIFSFPLRKYDFVDVLKHALFPPIFVFNWYGLAILTLVSCPALHSLRYDNHRISFYLFFTLNYNFCHTFKHLSILHF